MVNSIDYPENLTDQPAPSSPPKEGWRGVLGTIGLILLAPALALFITAFVMQSYQVDGQSMETTLQNDDRLLVNKLPRTISRLTHHAYIPKRGDIIIFNQSGVTAGFGGDKQLIKRVIALPGERITVKENRITVFNQAHPDGFNPDLAGQYHLNSIDTPGNVDVTLGSSQIFVCGDNRDNSEDSRYFGPVEVKNIVGRLALRVLPIGKPHNLQGN